MAPKSGLPDDPKRESFSAGLGYPRFQLAKALQHAETTGDPKALHRAEKWYRVIAGMLSGRLNIGSRTPIFGVPAWVTPEVARGGFATGAFEAGGALRPHEVELANELGLLPEPEVRIHLNQYFVSDSGLARLAELLDSGCFSIQTPEEGVLLIVAWLVRQGELSAASELVKTVMIYFDRLRFFPIPTDNPAAESSRIYLQDVATTIDQLESIGENANITAQSQAIKKWIPLYDDMVSALLETVDGLEPAIAVDSAGRPIRDNAGRYEVSGGLPCAVFPVGWREHVQTILETHQAYSREDCLCRRRTREDTPYARLLALLRQCISNPNAITESERRYARLVLGRYIAKRGTPNSEKCKAERRLQRRQCDAPTHRQLSDLLIERLRQFPMNRGLEEPPAVLGPVSAVEATAYNVPFGSTFHRRFTKVLRRSQIGTIESLVDMGVLSSPDMLAAALPQITSTVISGRIPDRAIARVYSECYRAFRRRRTLLLLNLESQIKFHQLPWIMVVNTKTPQSAQRDLISKETLVKIAYLSVRHFSYAILPNKLLQEMRALANEAKLEAPLVEELAADIFMGRFSRTFTAAAAVAARVVENTLYSRYYGIDYSTIFGRTRPASNALTDQYDSEFANACWRRAGHRPGSNWNVAINGTVIEQQQILTTQNLATLFDQLDLRTALDSELALLAEQCFKWICGMHRLPPRDRHTTLIVLKKTAYAWRQMIFYLSFLSESQQESFRIWIERALMDHPSDFSKRLWPAVVGLGNAISGVDVMHNGGRRYLGWVVGQHWLIADSSVRP